MADTYGICPACGCEIAVDGIDREANRDGPTGAACSCPDCGEDLLARYDPTTGGFRHLESA